MLDKMVSSVEVNTSLCFGIPTEQLSKVQYAVQMKAMQYFSAST